MDEKKVIKLTDMIVEDIVDFSMGKGKLKAMMPNSVARKMVKNPELFEQLKQCYIEYLSSVDCKIDETNEVRRLTEFRYKLLDVYNQTAPAVEGDVDLDAE